jgi:hypothetical protein
VKLFSKLAGLFRGHHDDHREVIAQLVLAAREDEALQRRIEFVLQLPTVQRQSIINTALHEMELRGESNGVREGFAALATDAGAEIALRAV